MITMRSTNNETLCISPTYSCVFLTVLKINNDYVYLEVFTAVYLEVFTAVWLTTSFYWNMTLHRWVIESRNFEIHCAFVFQGLVMSDSWAL
jgi:hypothetical protein